MVRTIKTNTYRCSICKKIYTSKKQATECEEDCNDEKKYVYIPKTVHAKMDGRRVKIAIYDRVLNAGGGK